MQLYEETRETKNYPNHNQQIPPWQKPKRKKGTEPMLSNGLEHVLGTANIESPALLQIQDFYNPIFHIHSIPPRPHSQAHRLITQVQLTPIALVKSPFPSLNNNTSSPTFKFSFQAFITNASLTEIQAMVSTPLALNSAAFSTKPGRCFCEQVGVNAPGTAKRMVFLLEVSRYGDRLELVG
ncbi:hypothetical protein Pfo_028673 [Paulownia fortunei]|nr:hypothetical protein Pfo_028673 [Paulownia fortunei]